MKRIDGVRTAEAGLWTRLAYWFTKRRTGQVSDAVTMLAHHPAVLQDVLRLDNTLRTSELVPAKLKALARERVAAVLGGSAAPRESFDAAERAVAAYADALSRDSVHVGDALFAELQWRFTEAQIVELTAVIAWANFQARFERGLTVSRGTDAGSAA